MITYLTFDSRTEIVCSITHFVHYIISTVLYGIEKYLEIMF